MRAILEMIFDLLFGEMPLARRDLPKPAVNSFFTDEDGRTWFDTTH